MKSQRVRHLLPIKKILFIKQVFRLFLAGTLALFLSSCFSSEEREFKLGQIEVEKSNFMEALPHFERAILRDPAGKIGVAAAREAAKICFFETKNFKKAGNFYSHLVLYSKDQNERIFGQKQLVSVYFDHLADYSKSILEINKILSMPISDDEKLAYKISLARTYYYQNNFQQAENEVDEFLKGVLSDDHKFSMLMLKGNISLARKDLLKAAKIFKEIIENYPVKGKKENVGVTLAVTYEEMNDYKAAISTLEWVRAFHPVPEYIDIRIRRLQERQQNQPGAKGLRK